MIFVGRISEMNPEYDENWAIVRKPGNLPDYAIHVPELAPSPQLFESYRLAVSQKIFNKEYFENYYVPEYIEQIAKPETISILYELCDLSKKKRVFLACFCENPEICHRSIVTSILYHMGAEISPVPKGEHRKYYEMYLEKMKLKNFHDERNKYFQQLIQNCDSELLIRIQKELPLFKQYIADYNVMVKGEKTPEIIITNSVMRISVERIKKWRNKGWECGHHRFKSRQLFIYMLRQLFTNEELKVLVNYCLQHEACSNTEEDVLRVLLMKAPYSILINCDY